jgi:hypothetical protein
LETPVHDYADAPSYLTASYRFERATTADCCRTLYDGLACAQTSGEFIATEALVDEIGRLLLSLFEQQLRDDVLRSALVSFCVVAAMRCDDARQEAGSENGWRRPENYSKVYSAIISLGKSTFLWAGRKERTLARTRDDQVPDFTAVVNGQASFWMDKAPGGNWESPLQRVHRLRNIAMQEAFRAPSRITVDFSDDLKWAVLGPKAVCYVSSERLWRRPRANPGGVYADQHTTADVRHRQGGRGPAGHPATGHTPPPDA